MVQLFDQYTKVAKIQSTHGLFGLDLVQPDPLSESAKSVKSLPSKDLISIERGYVTFFQKDAFANCTKLTQPHIQVHAHQLQS